jgi:hypothetical protein
VCLVCVKLSTRDLLSLRKILGFCEDFHEKKGFLNPDTAGNRQQGTGNSDESLFMAIFSLIVKLINLKYAVNPGC